MTTKINGKKQKANEQNSKFVEKANVIAVEKTSGKENGKAIEVKTNGHKAIETEIEIETEKVIPTEDWKNFAEFWDNCEWKDLNNVDIKKNLGNGKYLFVAIPKDITDPKIGKAWYDELKQFKELSKGGFGNYRVNFAGQTATLESVFGKDPITPSNMTKVLHLYINDHSLSSKNPEPKPEPKPEIKTEVKTNGKNVVKVNSISAMEKAVDTIKPKKGKK